MNVDVIFLPSMLHRPDLPRRTVVVFDVLRATTTMAAALAAGVTEIRIFGDIESARQACSACDDLPRLLCGETNCLAPPGFDLGNSPGAFDASHKGKTLFMSTTNGTRAIIAAAGAKTVLIGALVNATAVAKHAVSLGHDITLLCAGTNGEIAMEDVLGAGAVLSSLSRFTDVSVTTDTARLALRLFTSAKDDLPAALSDAQGGRNVLAAGLPADIAFAARLDSLTAVGLAKPDPLRIVPAT